MPLNAAARIRRAVPGYKQCTKAHPAQSGLAVHVEDKQLTLAISE